MIIYLDRLFLTITENGVERKKSVRSALFILEGNRCAGGGAGEEGGRMVGIYLFRGIHLS
jgi:hypothetical protein